MLKLFKPNVVKKSHDKHEVIWKLSRFNGWIAEMDKKRVLRRGWNAVSAWVGMKPPITHSPHERRGNSQIVNDFWISIRQCPSHAVEGDSGVPFSSIREVSK
jgi:hypothetical protein